MRTLLPIAILSLISICCSETDPIVCQYDSTRYVSKDFVLAVEDYPFGVLTSEIFEGVNGAIPRLNSLILRNDSVHTIFPDTFMSLRKLQCLDLSRNQMRSLSDSMFRGLRSLETLILRNNKITKLGDSEFVSVGKLKVLDLSFNSIQSLSDAALRGLVNLEELNFEGNHLDDIPPLLFYHTPNIRRLNLRGNHLMGLDASMLQLLQSLDLSSNQLSYIPTLTDSVETLNLTGNQISNFDGLTVFENLNEISAASNPLDCSCEVRKISLKFKATAKCSTPQELKGQNLPSAICETTTSGRLELESLDLTVFFSSTTQGNPFAFPPSIPAPVEPTTQISPFITTTEISDSNTLSDFLDFKNFFRITPSNIIRQYQEGTLATDEPPDSNFTIADDTETNRKNSTFTNITTTITNITTAAKMKSNVTTERRGVANAVTVPNVVAPTEDEERARNAFQARILEFLKTFPNNNNTEEKSVFSHENAISKSKPFEEALNSTKSDEKSSVPPVSLLNAITILIALAFGLGLCLIFMVIFMLLSKIKNRRSHELEHHGKGAPVRLYAPPMFSVSPLHSDIIMRSTYGRAEGLRVVEERDEVYCDIHGGPHTDTFASEGFHRVRVEESEEQPNRTVESSPQSLNLSDNRPLWAQQEHSTSSLEI